MKAMVLAAGRGTRMGHLTDEVPKPMLEVAGKPILVHILANLVRHGFTEVVLNLNHAGGAILDRLGSTPPPGVHLTFVRETELLGTAGSVRNARPQIGDLEGPLLVHYGDVLTDQDLGAMLTFHRDRRALATLLLHQRAVSNSLVRREADGRITELVERPSEAERQCFQGPAWVNSGVYLLEPEVLDLIPDRPHSDFPKEVFPQLIPSGRLFGFPLSGYRCAIDSPERLAQARRDYEG